MMKDFLKDNMILIMTYGYMFLCGIGIGAAITDAINRGIRNEKYYKAKHDRISAAQTIRQMRIESERKRSKDSRSGQEDEHQDKGQQP